MQCKKNFFRGCLLFLTVLASTKGAHGKSVFAITTHVDSTIKVYEIDDDQILYQDDADSEDFGAGAVGICAWDDLELMFITYELSDKIAWASTRTLERDEDDEISTGVSHFAGIVADQVAERIYAVKRYSDRLYTYLWDPINKTLVLDHPNDPNYPDRKYYPLEGLTVYPSEGAYGLAIDEPNGLIYVTDTTKTIRYYDTNNWQYKGSIDVGMGAVGVAIDPNNGQHPGYLYAGHWTQHTYLIKYNLDGDPNTLIEKNLDSEWEGSVIGACVDQDTGLVYVTTFRDGGTIEVYDTLGWTSDPAQTISPTDIESDGVSGPAGICVSAVTYTPPMTISKDDGVSQGQCVCPRGEITYSLCYKYVWNDPNDPNAPTSEGDPTNVEIVDFLPDELTFDWASDGGTYSAGEPGEPNRTVTWDLSSLSPGAEDCVELVVHTNPLVAGGTIKNRCRISCTLGSKDYSKYIEIDTDVCDCTDCGGVIYVDPNVAEPNNGSSWQEAFDDVQDALAVAYPCDETWLASPSTKISKNFFIFQDFSCNAFGLCVIW